MKTLILFIIFFSCNSEVSVETKKSSSPFIDEVTKPEKNGSWNTFDYNIYVGLQDTSLNDFIYQFHFDTGSPLSGALTSVDNAEVFVDGNLRTLSMNNDGDIIAGGSGEVTPPLYDKNYNLVKTTSPTGALNSIGDSHAICALPNGNYIIAEGVDTTGNIVNEYDQDDNFVREVYTSVKGDHGSITQCLAIDNETIIWIETGTWNWTNSNLMRMKLVGANWIVDQVLDSETYDPGNGTNFWNFTIHSDNHVYFSPGRRDGARFNQLLKCPVDDLSVGACSTFGDPIPGATSGSYLTWGRGIVQIPGSNDMLVFISQEVFHLNYSTGVYTSVLDLTTVFGTIDVVRSVILAPK